MDTRCDMEVTVVFASHRGNEDDVDKMPAWFKVFIGILLAGLILLLCWLFGFPSSSSIPVGVPPSCRIGLF